MPQYYGKPPSIDLLSQASEVRAAFDTNKLGETPADVESFAWGFLQSNFEPAMDELVLAGLPGYNSFAKNPNIGRSGHPQAVDGSTGTQGPPGPSGSDMSCQDVCNCNCSDPGPPDNKGACCLPSGHSAGDCIYTTPANCATQGGTYMGHGVSCGSAQCGGVEPSDEWTSGNDESSECNSPGCPTDSKTTDESTTNTSSSSHEWSPSTSGFGDPGIGSGYPNVEFSEDRPGPKPPGPGGNVGVWFSESAAEDGGCISETSGGYIEIPPYEQPHTHHFFQDNKEMCCGDPCKERCTDPNCWTRLPNCIPVPSRTIVVCPCGPNVEYNGSDPDQTPWQQESVPGGTKWKFNVPSNCCCGQNEIPDTDDDGVYSGSPAEITPGAGGEVCIRVIWEMYCSGGDNTPPKPGVCSICQDCDEWWSEVHYSIPTEHCKDCCKDF